VGNHCYVATRFFFNVENLYYVATKCTCRKNENFLLAEWGRLIYCWIMYICIYIYILADDVRRLYRPLGTSHPHPSPPPLATPPTLTPPSPTLASGDEFNQNLFCSCTIMISMRTMCNLVLCVSVGALVRHLHCPDWLSCIHDEYTALASSCKSLKATLLFFLPSLPDSSMHSCRFYFSWLHSC
jgi:hypothetical protein